MERGYIRKARVLMGKLLMHRFAPTALSSERTDTDTKKLSALISKYNLIMGSCHQLIAWQKYYSHMVPRGLIQNCYSRRAPNDLFDVLSIWGLLHCIFQYRRNMLVFKLLTTNPCQNILSIDCFSEISSPGDQNWTPNQHKMLSVIYIKKVNPIFASSGDMVYLEKILIQGAPKTLDM